MPRRRDKGNMGHAADADFYESEANATKSPLLSSAAMDDNIKIKIGEKTFKTTKSTLRGECAFFDALFDDGIHGPDNGIYELDRDTDAFERVLCYCQTKLYPLYLSSTGEFDTGRYAFLQNEADFYGCDKLATWISSNEYVNVLKYDKRHWTIKVESRSGQLYGQVLKDISDASFSPSSDGPFGLYIVLHTLQTIFGCSRDIRIRTSQNNFALRREDTKLFQYAYVRENPENWAIFVTKKHDKLSFGFQ